MTFILQLLQKKGRDQHRDLFASFVDLSKTFDTVDREQPWKTLWKFGCPANFVSVIKSFHDGMNASVSAAGEASDPFCVLAGMK